MRRFHDVLGNQLLDGDEVVTIRKNGRAVGGDLVTAIVRIDGDKLKFDPQNLHYGSLYKIGLESKVVKVFKKNDNLIEE